MRKRMNGIITFLCFMCVIIGGAGLDAEDPRAAVVLACVGAFGIFAEGFYWRRIYER